MANKKPVVNVPTRRVCDYGLHAVLLATDECAASLTVIQCLATPAGASYPFNRRTRLLTVVSCGDTADSLAKR